MKNTEQSGRLKLIGVLGAALLWAGGILYGEEIPGSGSAMTAESVHFKTHDGFEMFGRLVLPASQTPRAIVIYVQAAEGMTVDMKRPLGGKKTFNYYDLYRKKFPEMDVGFFSYEGRGIRMGDSPPRYEKIHWEVYNTSTLENKAQDVISAIEALRKQDGLNQVPVFLMGASEGTLIAAEAASMKPTEISGLVLYGVLATNLRETFTFIMSDGEFMRFRLLDADKDGTITRDEWEKLIKEQDFSAADLNSDGKFTVDDIKVATKKYLDAIKADDYKVLQDWATAAAAVAVPNNWFEDHFNHKDNWSFLSQLNIPVGCFHGDGDRMTPIMALKDLESKTRQAGLKKMEFHYFEGLDHSLNITRYFTKGEIPAGHQAIFNFVDRIATIRDKN